MKQLFRNLGLASTLLLLACPLFVLPLSSRSVYLSPDETAVAATIHQFARTGSFHIPFENLKVLPWAHPRSFVTQGASIVPVGFLGLPALLSVIFRVVGDHGIHFFTPLLTLSIGYVVWSLTRSWGKWAARAAVIGWLTFPTVILYANRGLFANLPVLCLAIWSCWLILQAKRSWHWMLAGGMAGLALSMRPTEAVWILPWIFGSWMFGREDIRIKIRPYIYFFIPFVCVISLFAWLGSKTYDAWFVAGYQLRDPVITVASEVMMESVVESAKGDVPTSLFATWPFGFHPRNVWFNVRSYLIEYLFPWAAIVIAAAYLAWRDKKNRRWILLGVWTVAVLCLAYGQGLYQDHVQVNRVALANSFLRYLLPSAFIFALSCGWLIKHALPGGKGDIGEGRLNRKYVGVFFIFCLATLGFWTAFARDDEGLLQNRKELAKYNWIRSEAINQLGEKTIILSERSDKIFFPIFQTASPLPMPERLFTSAVVMDTEYAMFLRTQTPEQLMRWRERWLELQLLFTSENESLYRVKLL